MSLLNLLEPEDNQGHGVTRQMGETNGTDVQHGEHRERGRSDLSNDRRRGYARVRWRKLAKLGVTASNPKMPISK